MSKPAESERSSRPSTERLLDAWFRFRIPIGLIGTLLLAILVGVGPEPNYQISLEGLFPADDPLILSQTRAREAFGDNRFVLLAYEDPEVMSPEGIQRAAQIEEQIREIDGVRDVLCLASLDRQLKILGTSITAENRLSSHYRKMFLGFTHDKDESVAGFICLLAPLGSLNKEGQVIASLRGVVRQPPGQAERGIVVGEPVLIADAFASIRRDSARLQIAATLLLAIVLALCLRSLRWILVVFGIVLLSIMATQSVGGLLGLRWSLLSSMLPAIILVIGAGALTHLAVWSRRWQLRGLPVVPATKQSVRRVFWPVLATCVTDAMGFLAILVSPITPLREFALMVSVGIFLFLLTAFLLFPLLGCWALASHRNAEDRGVSDEPAFSTFSNSHASAGPTTGRVSDDRGATDFHRRSRWCAIGFTAMVAVAAGGILRLDLETDITKSFRRRSPLAVSFRFVEKQLGGAGIWEVHIPVPDNFDRSFVTRVQTLQEELRNLRVPVADQQYPLAELSSVVSLVDVITSTDNSPNFILANTPIALRLQGVRAAMPVFYDTLLGTTDDGQTYLRILLRSQDARSVAWKQALIMAVEEKVAQHFPPPGLTATRPLDAPPEPLQVGGTFVVISQMIARLVADQWRTLGVALICILATLLVFVRGVFSACLALVPSVLAILFILGTIGWLGIRVDLGVVMIAAVSLGMAVDGAIHMLNAIAIERHTAPDEATAILRGVRANGGPLGYATLAVVAGFSTMAISDFIPSVTFGLLVGAATVVGLIANLTVLPWLIYWSGGFVGRLSWSRSVRRKPA